MGFHRIAGTTTEYGLIVFDKEGEERPEGAHLFTESLLQKAAAEEVTDIFFFCHGWKGDVPESIRQYDLWMKALINSADHAKAAQVFPNFKMMLIGLHWPSLPWGDEELGPSGSFAPGTRLSHDVLLKKYVERFGDRPEIRTCLNTIIEEARQNAAPPKLPNHIEDAYKALCKALGICPDAEARSPDTDYQKFDPQEIYELAQDEGSDFGGFSLGGLLSPLRQLSYWTMKQRARTIGEGGMHNFLRKLQMATQARIHLMGHSFGTIVVSGMLGGPGGNSAVVRPVDSVALIQGAVSLWSYCSNIPFAGAGAGYFKDLLTDGKVNGPIVVTRSRYDRAVGVFYPLASQVQGSASFGPRAFPELGAMGAWGLQGLGPLQSDLKMLPANGPYSSRKEKSTTWSRPPTSPRAEKPAERTTISVDPKWRTRFGQRHLLRFRVRYV